MRKETHLSELFGFSELVGGGQKWEYVKGMFGGDLTCHPQRIVVGEPRLGCEPLTNSKEELQDSMVILNRGTCSFADKVAFAQDSGAAGVIIANTGNFIFLSSCMGFVVRLQRLGLENTVFSSAVGEELIRMPAGWLKYPSEIAIKIPVIIVRQTTAAALRKIIGRDTVVHGQVRSSFFKFG